MSVERTASFQQTTPRRPALADVLAGTKQNSTPTVPPTHPSAEEFHQMAGLLVALGRMTPLIRLSVDFTTGTPTIVSAVTVRDDVLIADFAAVDHADGDTEITWVTANFPGAISRPMAALNGEATANGSRAPFAVMTAPSAGVTGVRVKTRDHTGALVDIPFTVEVF